MACEGKLSRTRYKEDGTTPMNKRKRIGLVTVVLFDGLAGPVASALAE